MELSKAFHISVDYKDRKSAVNWEMLQFAEVIFVDKTHPANRPLLYQLSDPKLSLEQILNTCKSNYLSFSKESFLLVGEVTFIDKKKKQISLTNKNIIAYNHLVIASGKKPILSFQDGELAAALQALTDALRVKPKIPHSFPTSLKNPSAFMPLRKQKTFAVSDKSAISNDEQTIGKIVHPYIVALAPKFNINGLNDVNSRFYEVQT